MESSRSFKDLKVWQKARELRTEISTLTKGFPNDEKYLLSSQMTRASRSITANIAEGHGRFHFKENIQFCRQSRGSAAEMIDHLIVALDEEYIDTKTFEALELRFEEIMKMLNGYISYLQKQHNPN
jgi:four helix bundle protein